MTRKIHYSDDLEEFIGTLLTELNIEFTHESEVPTQDLDFYLPKFDIYIEVKQFHADRIVRQLGSKDNVIVIQGRKSIGLIKSLIKTATSQT